MRILFLSFILVFALQAIVSAQLTRVVDQDGQFLFDADAPKGVDCEATGETALATIENAIVAAGEGDTIIVCPGLYDEEVLINKNRLTLTGQAGATLDGQNTKMVGLMLAAGVKALIIQGFTIRHYTRAGLLAVQGSTSHVTVQFNEFIENANGVVVGNEPGHEGEFTHVYFCVLNAVLTNNTAVGVSFTNCRSCRIQRSTISGGQSGIILRAHNNGDLFVKANRILLNTVVQTEEVGILAEAVADGAGKNATLRNTTLQNNTVTDVATGAAIQFRASGAATLSPGRILRSTINCLPGNPDIQWVEDNGGSIEKITKLNNKTDSECSP